MSEAVLTLEGYDEESIATDRGPDDCGCTTLMPCWDCYTGGRRGRPAIRRALRCR